VRRVGTRRVGWRRIGWVLLWMAAAAATAADKAPDNSSDAHAIFAEIDRTLVDLADISGLKLHKKVPSDIISKQKVNEFLKKKVKEVSTPEELRAEELTLKKLGLVPADFDLAKNTVDVLTEQAAAFYDYHAKRLFITDWTPSSNREAALAHELAHALADQHFNLNRFIKKARESDDGALARMAVMEGQATWLMSEFLARRLGQTLVHNSDLAQRMNRMSDSASTGEFPVFEGSPLYIRATLIFPYSGGMAFQQAVVERNGKSAFAENFRRPPISTQQIIHPDKNFANVTPVTPELPKAPPLRGYKGLIGGTLGELDHQILLQQFAGNEAAMEIAPHWRGGRYELIENRKKGRTILLYASQWDDAEWAQKFLQAYRRVLAGKWKSMKVDSESAGVIKGHGDDGAFVLRRDGATVSSLEGMESQ
jgi:hypothetical protein